MQHGSCLVFFLFFICCSSLSDIIDLSFQTVMCLNMAHHLLLYILYFCLAGLNLYITLHIQYHHTYHVTVSYFQGFVKIVGKVEFYFKGRKN